jgi:hypothetical protein
MDAPAERIALIFLKINDIHIITYAMRLAADPVTLSDFDESQGPGPRCGEGEGGERREGQKGEAGRQRGRRARIESKTM